ncbi:MAG: deoxyribose-phosphate aldolase [Bacteriovoracia bacterium]
MNLPKESAYLTDKIAKLIDHTLLRPEATKNEILNLCNEAKKYGFATACVNSSFVEFAVKAGAKVTAVVGFPLGACATEIKVKEAGFVVEKGAAEIDMVVNLGLIKEARWAEVENEIRLIANETRGKILKVILETCLLTDQEKIAACKVSENAGAQFVKTSTGFSKGGATVADIALMRKSVSESMGVKASGGIKTLADAIQMVEAGATRLGTSQSVAIVTQSITENSSY